ncbi:MAG: hypothetical protein AAGM22_18650 [Acidobacteriota bacterium]
MTAREAQKVLAKAVDEAIELGAVGTVQYRDRLFRVRRPTPAHSAIEGRQGPLQPRGDIVVTRKTPGPGQQRQTIEFKAFAASIFLKPYDYGSEGLGFESLRVHH